jgi:hypothetical protein
MLGASPNADLLAHLFGLVAGLVVGLVAALALRGKTRSSPAVQIVSAGLTAAIIVACWSLALHAPYTPDLLR